MEVGLKRRDDWIYPQILHTAKGYIDESNVMLSFEITVS